MRDIPRIPSGRAVVTLDKWRVSTARFATRATRAYPVLNRFLSMCSERIFDSRVERGMPSFAAAPSGPATRPREPARAVSMSSVSSRALGRPNGGLSARGPNALLFQPRLVHHESVLAQDDGPLNDVLELADVAGPVVRRQKLDRPAAHTGDLLSGSRRVPVRQILDE